MSYLLELPMSFLQGKNPAKAEEDGEFKRGGGDFVEMGDIWKGGKGG